MKLSKKIGLLFICTTIITIILYIVSSQITADYLYQGEKTRITGITSGCIGRLEGKINRTLGKGHQYKDMLRSMIDIKREHSIDIFEEMEIIEKFEKDEFDANYILDSQLNIVEEVVTRPIGDKDQEIIEYIKGCFPVTKPVSGVVSTTDASYILVITGLDRAENAEMKYFLGITEMDQAFMKEVEGETEKKVKLVRKLEEDKLEVSRVNPTTKIFLHYTEDNIQSYYEVKQLWGKTPLYLEVQEPLIVRNTNRQNIMIFTTLLIILCSVINILVWILINKILVKPVFKMNQQIKNISDTRDFTSRLEPLDTQDEIGILTRDVNQMLDALEEVQVENRLKDKKYSTLLQSMNNAFATCKIIYSIKSQKEKIICIECNEAMAKIYGQTVGAICDPAVEVGEDDPRIIETIKSAIRKIKATGEIYSIEQAQITKDYWGQLAIYLTEEETFSVIITDITKLKEYSNKMQYMANYDGLTGLQNRYSLYEYGRQLIEGHKEFAIYFMDLDNFKKINDTIGHTEGDKILCEVANKLKGLIDPQTFISRVGGDEFIIIRRGELNNGAITQFGNRIIEKISSQIEEVQCQFPLSVSIGVSLYPYNGNNIEELLKYADIAMYEGKRKGGNMLEIFSEKMLEKIDMEAKLKDALENEELVAYYQPIYHLQKEQIIGAEALVRWIRDGEVIPPYKFIDIAKQTGAIVDIDFLVLEQACAFCKEWQLRGNETFIVSVNMSFKSLSHPELFKRIETALGKAGMQATSLKIEITEDEIIEKPKHIIDILNGLRALGIQISLDDFGVGYSSFNHIKMLPIDTLKIDRSLILKLEEDEKTVAIIETLIELGHNLGLDIVCEGVEVKEQLDKLKMIQCDTIQGYYISQPVENELFERCMEHYGHVEVLKEVE